MLRALVISLAALHWDGIRCLTTATEPVCLVLLGKGQRGVNQILAA